MIKLNTIYSDNCLNFMNNLMNESVFVDVIVTSPQYNIRKKYFSYKDDKKRTGMCLRLKKLQKKVIKY